MQIDPAIWYRLPAGLALDLARNLWAGCRLALFLPVARWHFRASLPQVFLLLLLSVAFNFAYDYAMTQPDNRFSVAGLNYQASLYLLFLSSIVLIAAARRAYPHVLALLVLILSITPTTFVGYAVLAWGLQWQNLLTPDAAHQAGIVTYLAWYLLIVLRVFRKMFRPGLAAAAAIFAIYVGFNVVPWFLLPHAPLWERNVALEADRSRAGAFDLEELFQRQRPLLEALGDRILPQRPGVIDLYFVGFAGYGAEDVFMNEAQAARRVFDERFDTRGRSLLLVNNEKTLTALPLASARNLRTAVGRIVRHFDPEEDVLALFLTSHGEEGAGLTLDLGFYELKNLTPALLRETLSGAGVKWRVIIVSACFSGAFVEELQDPATLIIASARADRSSFGCGHDGDFTYFGQAFIDQELRMDFSLVSAFEKARAGIREREKREGRTPSEPQISIGSDIQPVLERLAEQLREGRAPAPSDESKAFALVKYAPRLKYGGGEAMFPDPHPSFEQ